MSAAALSSLMQSDGCPPLVLEAVMGHSSSGHAFIPGEAELGGTLRSLTKEGYDVLEERTAAVLG